MTGNGYLARSAFCGGGCCPLAVVGGMRSEMAFTVRHETDEVYPL